MSKALRQNFLFWLLSVFWLFDLLNPVFKKYDYGAEYPLVIAFAVLILILAALEYKRARENSVAIKFEKLFLLIFGLFVVLSFAFSQTKNVGFSETLAFSTMVIFYLIYVGQKITWTTKFLKIVKIGAVLSVILAFILYFWREETRMVGPFFNILYHANVWPNAFALFLLMVWPVFLTGWNRNKFVKFLNFGGLVFVLSALMLTFSRGALLVFAIQAVILFIYFLKNINFRKFGLILLTGVLSFGIFTGSNYLRSLNHKIIDVGQRITFANSESLTSKQERMDFWKGAFELAKQKPFFGWGPFSFRFAYSPIQKTFLGNADHPHNIFLKIAAENGLIALAAFLLFLVTVLFTVLKRTKTLSKYNKKLVIVLSVAIIGAFMHSMIDYNFNFLPNLMLLFILMIFVRSLVVKKNTKEQTSALALFLASVIGFIALYEGAVFVLAQTNDQSFLKYSLYPRNYYLSEADSLLKEGEYEKALENLDAEIKLNPLDSQALHLKGVILCNNDYVTCNDLIAQAIELNPMNDFSYYVDYLRPLADRNIVNTFEVLPGRYSVYYVINRALELLKIYFDYVENNVHFTAYTPNVEAAAELTDMIVNNYPLDSVQKQNLLNKKQKMLKTAKKLRAEKPF